MKKSTLLLALFFLGSGIARAATYTPDEAIKELKMGNERYVSGHSAHPRIDPIKRKYTALEGQKPLAAILGCADSRVPVEIVFDQAFADLFVVRVAGNVCGNTQLASLEYAVYAFKTPLIMVLGHTKCGAVQAAVAKKPLPGKIPDLVAMIAPAVAKAEGQKNAKEDLVERAARENVYHSMKLMLDQSPLIKEAVEAKKLKIIGGIRDIATGKVEFLTEQEIAQAPHQTATK